jgi:NTE family protein
VAVPGTLGFAAGTLLYAAAMHAHGSYAREFLPGALVMGLGIGLAVAGFAACTVAELPRDLYATASATAAALRQIGAALGIAAIVLLIGTAPDEITGFRRAWTLMTATSTLAAILGILIGPSAPNRSTRHRTRSTGGSHSAAPAAGRPRREHDWLNWNRRV